jgi:hypothetical protein
MEDDIISALTHEVKEDVIERYLFERRLMEEQITYVKELADLALLLQDQLYRRFARIYELLVEPRFAEDFARLLKLKEPPFFSRFGKDPGFRKGLQLIKAAGLTQRGRYKRLIVESYRRLLSWNKQYSDAYDNLREECGAVNHNLKKFERNHDLLTIINFLKDMDVETLQRKHFLGDNFTPEEMATVENTLRFKPVRVDQYNLIPPPVLPAPEKIKDQLGTLTNRAYDASRQEMKALIR